MSEPKSRSDLIHGTLDMLVLRTLRDTELHGWAISKRIALISENVLQVNQGSLYPALHRLEDRSWIRSRWGRAENGRRVKMYELTRAGAKRLEVEQGEWSTFVAGVGRILSHDAEAPA